MNAKKKSIIQRMIDRVKQLIRLYKIQLHIRKCDFKPSRRKCIDVITLIANNHNVDPKLMVKIAMCESGLKWNAVNINKDGSIDRGIFQWNDKYHPDIPDWCCFSVPCAAQQAAKAIKNGNLGWWSASQKCWDKEA